MVSSARTLNLRRANTHRHKIHARWGVMNVQDTLRRSGRNLPLFLDVPTGKKCGRVDAGLQGVLRRREALAAPSAGVKGGGSRSEGQW